MSTQAKRAANRANAQASTGPRTAAGKARSRYNSFRHGLSIPFDAALAPQARALTNTFGGRSESTEQDNVAKMAAHAHLEILRIRRRKADLINRAFQLCPANGGLSEDERRAFAFEQVVGTLVGFDRYERRALSKRKRALRSIRNIQETDQKHTGPPILRHKAEENPFERFVCRFRVNAIVKAALALGPHEDYTTPKGPRYCVNLKVFYPGVVSAAAFIQLDAPMLGLLNISLTCTHSDEKHHEFRIKKHATKIGRSKWVAVCPKTRHRVDDLYLDPTTWNLGSRHALQLRYRSRKLDRMDLAFNRREKARVRIGAKDSNVRPLRPKNMRRETFERLWRDFVSKDVAMVCIALGRPVPDLYEGAETAKPPRPHSPKRAKIRRRKGKHVIKAGVLDGDQQPAEQPNFSKSNPKNA